MQPRQRRIVPITRRILIYGVLFSALLALVPGGAAAPRPAVTPQASPPLSIWLKSVADLSPLGGKPLAITNAADGSGRLFITTQQGKVAIYDGTQVLPVPFLDISTIIITGLEAGLLSMAFDPQYGNNGYFYVDYSGVDNNGASAIVIARYQVSSDPNVADPTSAQVLLTISGVMGKHYGGQLQFGPDGYLYISTGDGGEDSTGATNNAQELNTLLGKILRIDVRNSNTGDDLPYDIPPGNPFAADGDPGTRDEIWTYGLRNPWRFSFDRQTGDMFIGDVGEGSKEEIDYQPAASTGGENYGWRCREGDQPFRQDSHCAAETFTEPILVHRHDQTFLSPCVVTGGYRYRGYRFTSLAGYYVYGDFCTGYIWAATRTGDRWTSTVLLLTGLSISAFGEDEAGELYVADLDGGQVYQIVAPVYPPISLEPVADMSQLGDTPTAITSAADGSNRLFIALRAGKIVIYDRARVLPTPFLDITALVTSDSTEQGLLSVAFDPHYTSNGYFYVDYTGSLGDPVIARYQRSASNPNIADPASAQILLALPYSLDGTNNGGQLQFGPDGYLYISTGDGGGLNGDGSGHNPQIGNAQDLNSLLGKILRIDVRNTNTGDGLPYDIPPSNPFAADGDSDTRAEIWAYGLHDPRRFSFDRQTGDMFIGDVGQREIEEIDYQPAGSSGGENYGWRCRRGNLSHGYDSHCATETFTEPILVYGPNYGCPVIGGYRYRGHRFTPLTGLYFYSGNCTIWAIRQDSDGRWMRTQILKTEFFTNAFGEDEAGELYVGDRLSGQIYQIAIARDFLHFTFLPAIWR